MHARLQTIASARGALDAREAELLVEERLRVAREPSELPQLHEALAAGRLHFSAVRELTRVATRDTEAAWLAAADGKSVRQVEHDLVYERRTDDVDRACEQGARPPRSQLPRTR